MEERLPRLKVDDIGFYNAKILYMSFLLRMVSDAEKMCKTDYCEGSEMKNEGYRVQAMMFFQSEYCRQICETFDVNYQAFKLYAEGKIKADPKGLRYKNNITGVKENRSTKNKKVV